MQSYFVVFILYAVWQIYVLQYTKYRDVDT